MKKIFTLLLLSICLNGFSQPLLVEDFAYPATEPLTGNNWTQIGTTTTNPISVTSSGLTFTGYPGSGVGNAAAMTTTGQDVYRDASSSISSGDAYVSFLINVSAAQAAGDYFFALLPTTSTTNFTARTFIKSSGTGFQIGIAKSTETVAYATDVLDFNTTYLVVLKYNFATGTTNDDQISLYVFDAATGVPATEPATADAVSAGTANDAASLGRIALRQGTASNAATLTVDGIRFASSWAGALPLDLLSFNASLINSSVNLTWITTNEVNVSGFAVEKSVNGREFSVIGNITAKGSLNTNEYSFIDGRVASGVNYYRLKMIDKDGSFKYSYIVTVKNKSEGLSIYPNPVKTNITIQHEVAEKSGLVRVLDLNGKQLIAVNLEVGAISTSIDASKLAPGTYIVVFSNNGEKLTKQFVKQ